MVTSYQTVAGTNAYAPLDQSAYFDRQNLTNVSLAVANVSDDWTGTNVGGTETTWHWIGSAQTSTTTAFNANRLTITGAGSFSYDLTTTAAFVEPTSVTTLYGPGSAANYECEFSIDQPASYTLNGQLMQYSLIQISSLSELIFRQRNFGVTPVDASSTGALAPGHYYVQVNASFGPPSGLTNGLHHESGGGGFDLISITVQVPEPGAVILSLFGISAVIGRVRWRHRMIRDRDGADQLPAMG